MRPFSPIRRRFPAILRVAVAAAAALAAPAAHASVPPVDAAAAWRAALAGTESPGIQAQSLEIARQRLRQARGGILPSVNLIAGYTKQQEVPGASAFTQSSQTTARINLAQPLFQGGREWAGLSSTKNLVEAEEIGVDRVRAGLWAAVSEAYYSVLQAERDREDLAELEKLSELRLGDIRDRVRIGRSRRADLLSAQSQYATAQALLAESRAVIDQARESFAFATGLPADSRLVPVPEDSAVRPLPPLAEWQTQAAARPDLRELEARARSADDLVSFARGGHLPSVDLSANYYLKRAGIAEAVKWDLGLQLVFPIFQGGAVSAQVGQAAAERMRADLALESARRDARREVAQAYARAAAGVEQVPLLTEAHRAARENYEAQRRDYGLGLVTNLEVIQALNTSTEARRSLDRRVFQALAARAALEAAAGKLPGASL